MSEQLQPTPPGTGGGIASPDGGDIEPYAGGDFQYDEAHAARGVPEPPRRARHAPPPVRAADADGDYSYDLAHDVPPGGG